MNPVEIQTDPANGAIKELIYSPVHWATLLPTDAAAIAARTGTVSYNNVVVVHGGGSGGGPLTTANVNFNANVNFDTGAVTAGALNINNGPEVWNMDFTGQVRGNVLDIPKSALTGNVTVTPTPARPIEGDMGMVFTGNSGQALGGGFSLHEIGNPGRHVEGILVVLVIRPAQRYYVARISRDVHRRRPSRPAMHARAVVRCAPDTMHTERIVDAPSAVP